MNPFEQDTVKYLDNRAICSLLSKLRGLSLISLLVQVGLLLVVLAVILLSECEPIYENVSLNTGKWSPLHILVGILQTENKRKNTLDASTKRLPGSTPEMGPRATMPAKIDYLFSGSLNSRNGAPHTIICLERGFQAKNGWPKPGIGSWTLKTSGIYTQALELNSCERGAAVPYPTLQNMPIS